MNYFQETFANKMPLLINKSSVNSLINNEMLQDHLLFMNKNSSYLTNFSLNSLITSDIIYLQSVSDSKAPRKYLFDSHYQTIIVAIVASLISLVTICGNVLVITAFIIDKNLRKYSNYFILNLSFADLLIGLLIPPYAPFLLYNYNWKLGRSMCIVWLVLDYVVGSASVHIFIYFIKLFFY